MSVNVFDDFGLSITPEDALNVLTPSYLSSVDRNLLGMTISAWILVLAGNVIAEEVRVEETVTNIRISLAEKNINTGRIFLFEKNEDGLRPFEHLIVYAGQEKPLWSVTNVLKQVYRKEDIIEYSRGGNNTYNVNIFHLLLQYGMFEEFREMYEWLGDMRLLQRREPVSGNGQVSPMVVILSKSMDIYEEGVPNPLEVICGETEDSELEGISFRYDRFFGRAGTRHSFDTSENGDDLVKFILSASHSEIIKVCTFRNERLRKIMRGSLYKGKKEVEAYIGTLRKCNTSQANTDSEEIPFPEQYDKYFAKEVFINRYKEEKYNQLTAIPALSYYIYRFRKECNLEVLRFLLEATLPNAMCVEDGEVEGVSPLAVLGEQLKIVRGGWDNLLLASFYKEMISTVGKSSGEIYMMAGEKYRMSEMIKRDLTGGMSMVLAEICKWRGTDETKDIAPLMEEVFPSCVKPKEVIDWGRMYGIILDGK